MPRYWLTPPELDYLRKDCFDPTPYPHSWGDRNALLIDWEKPWYLNPPFHMQTRFVRKAIQEGGPGTIVIPCHTPIHLLLEAGATLRPLGRDPLARSRYETTDALRDPLHRGIHTGSVYRTATVRSCHTGLFCL